jgi:hypothetical protein
MRSPASSLAFPPSPLPVFVHHAEESLTCGFGAPVQIRWGEASCCSPVRSPTLCGGVGLVVAISISRRTSSLTTASTPVSWSSTTACTIWFHGMEVAVSRGHWLTIRQWPLGRADPASSWTSSGHGMRERRRSVVLRSGNHDGPASRFDFFYIQNYLVVGLVGMLTLLSNFE